MTVYAYLLHNTFFVKNILVGLEKTLQFNSIHFNILQRDHNWHMFRYIVG